MRKTASNPESSLPPSFLLKAQGLRHAFGQRLVLDDVSIQVSTGETVAIVGASGSGKSTLLYALAGLRKPDSGTVNWGVDSVWDLGEPALTRLRHDRCGFMFQFPAFLRDLTIEENVAIPLVLGGQKMRQARRVANEMLERLGLASISTHSPGTLSGGELQRASLARALVTSPRIIFADEPTGTLDDANSAVVIDLLAEIARWAEVGVVIVTHDLAVAARADQVLRLTDGNLIASGTGALP